MAMEAGEETYIQITFGNVIHAIYVPINRRLGAGFNCRRSFRDRAELLPVILSRNYKKDLFVGWPIIEEIRSGWKFLFITSIFEQIVQTFSKLPTRSFMN